ncbi:ABC transporter ATP-binding protein [Streptomyces sp. ML-6]|uniref:ABC transporter ATP-binding protein n=1 Tax=Streptomyces sp. ML-6 TaxID=2982693 RepID=UPI0024BF7413|nr:ABC transporter ATP-binding protein [Streptomyces sp. ML-6]MDK0522479.1 ABC transporter ATP-binding protein/permease [Streptomyces sp. ML-6]
MTHRALLRYLYPFSARMLILAALIVVHSAATVIPALIGQQLIDNGVLRRDTTVVATLGALMVVVGVAQAALSVVERRYATRLAGDIVLQLRIDLFAHLQRQSIGFLASARTGAIVSRVQGDVTGVQNMIASSFPAAVGSVVLLLTGGVAVVTMEWRLTLGALVLAPALYVLTSRFTTAIRQVSQDQLTAQANLDSMVAERLGPGGAEVMRHYSHPKRDLPEFRQRVSRIRDLTVRASVLSSALGASITLAMSLVTATIYVIAGQLAISGALSVGTMVALVALLTRLYSPLVALPALRGELTEGLVSFDRVREVMDFVPAIVDVPDPHELPRQSGTSLQVAFRGVHFTYPPNGGMVLPSLGGDEQRFRGGAPRRVLTGMDFTAEPGATIGIVGLSGAGKSTLARLLTRSWEADSGQVLVGGVDVRRLRLDDLRSVIGVVSQDTFLFNDTIRVNLQLARPEATTEELVEACRAAQIWPAIDKLPAGLDTAVGDRGLRLSGGERQRLALARLLLKNPPIAVLDEATSHSDPITERGIMETMGPFLRDRTCIIIAHRLSTIRDADTILVMKGGRVVERGGHETLMGIGGWYARLHQAQQRTAQRL